MDRFLLLIGLLASSVHAQSKLVLTGTNDPLSLEDPAPTDPSLFTSLSSTITVSSDAAPTSSSVSTSTAANETLIISGNATATTTGGGPQPTNTRPCNGHPLFCDRAYSNITMVAAHNSPFVRPGNIASNQNLDVTAQLNDGIRMRCSSSPIRKTVYGLQLILTRSPIPNTRGRGHHPALPYLLRPARCRPARGLLDHRLEVD